MLELLAIPLMLLLVISDIIDAISLVVVAVKHWRITCGILSATLVILVLCRNTESPAIRWIAGFFIFVSLLTVGLVWEKKHSSVRG